MLVLGPLWWVWVAVTLLVNAVEEINPYTVSVVDAATLVIGAALCSH